MPEYAHEDLSSEFSADKKFTFLPGKEPTMARQVPNPVDEPLDNLVPREVTEKGPNTLAGAIKWRPVKAEGDKITFEAIGNLGLEYDMPQNITMSAQEARQKLKLEQSS